MVAFNGLHKTAFVKWLKARNQEVDYQSIDFESLWDSSLSVSENFSTIESKLEEYGLGKTKWTKQEHKEWENRASEWYQNEIKQNEEIEQHYKIEYFSLDGFEYYGFENDDVEYVIFARR